VHAKSGGAFGHFEVTDDVSAFTRAALFQPRARTETLLRFSTIAAEQGSADTVRDPRGFPLKYHFVTDQGVETFTADEAKAMVAEDADFHRRDLHTSIKNGQHPSWTL
jgi:catalase